MTSRTAARTGDRRVSTWFIMGHMAQRLPDATDRAILRLLQDDGRISNVELAKAVGLSPAAMHARVRRLEADGTIARYAAVLEPETAGFDLTCFVSIAMQLHSYERVAQVREQIAAMPEVLECHHITGEYDYLLKVVLRNRRDLQRFIIERITPLPGIARIQTSLALAVVKSTTALPIEA
jgi:Lrp/AsnC family leucine-responsive transcriptional regulator